MKKAALFLISAVLSFSIISSASDSAVKPSAENEITTPPSGYDPFFSKYLDCGGIPVIGSSRVADAAFYRVRELLNSILANRPDIHQALADAGVKYVIVAHDEQVTDIPMYSHMQPKEYWNERARGFGGLTTSCGEENLLNMPMDRYEDESIFVHELAHAIHSPALQRIDPTFQPRLEALYRKAMDKGLYKYDYASTNPSEYWAENVQAYFNCDRQTNWNHNEINTRQELAAYDPEMKDFIAEIFRFTDENAWSYVPLKKQPSVIPVPSDLETDPVFRHYVWCRGFSIFGTAGVSEAALLEADRIVRNMFRYRHDVLKALIDGGLELAVYEDGQKPANLTALNPAAFVDAQDPNRPAVTLPKRLRFGVPQSNLLDGLNSRPNEASMLIGAMAKALLLYTGFREVDPAYDSRRLKQQYEKDLERLDRRTYEKVRQLYQRAMEQGLWKGTAAAQNAFDYFAAGVQAFFDGGSLTAADGQPLGTRQHLQEHDPRLEAFISGLFKHPERVDWRLR
ncbi:MAG TPA: hypothetical protein PKV53_03705 [Anaerohalosphaeraceae bacterium]|nr:hypothetical protein [Anaerohalosphaeraceae bacterium]